ncbi:MAG: hypothetical protein J5789_05370 [Oscillospiraceae bacterium]|nr:hypothetical protein [Oscillospiraceae bacterium]
MTQQKKRKGTGKWNAMTSTLIYLGLGLVMSLCSAPLYFLLAYADVLRGWLFTLLLVLYIGLIAAGGMFLLRRRSLRHERNQLGDEVFFEMYPREWRRELRRRGKLATSIWVAQRLTAQDYSTKSRRGWDVSEETLRRCGIDPDSLRTVPYDEIYYSGHPGRLSWDLFWTRLSKIFCTGKRAEALALRQLRLEGLQPADEL